MSKLLNISTSTKWLMPEDAIIDFSRKYESMVQANNFANISQDDIQKSMDSHINIKYVETANLSEIDKQAVGVSLAPQSGKKDGRVAIVEMFGTFLTRWDWFILYFGGVAMDRAVMILDMLEAEQQIDGVVLHIDSNGGALAGTESLGKRIAKFKKPIVAFCDNACHSAAYWIASQCDQILSAGDTTYLGSIGVMMRHINRQAANEQDGIAVSYIPALQSTKKIKAPDNQPLSEDDFQELQAILSKDAAVFISQVKKGRGDKIDIDAVSNADIFISKDAKKLGLHDGRVTDGINTAIKRVLELAKDSNDNKMVELNKEEKLTSNMEFGNIKVKTSKLTLLGIAQNKKLVIMSKSSLEELDSKFAGVDLGDYEKEPLEKAKVSFSELGIKGISASVINVARCSNEKFTLVDSEVLAGLEKAIVSADASTDDEPVANAGEDNPTEDPVSTDEPVEDEPVEDNPVEYPVSDDSEPVANTDNPTEDPASTDEPVEDEPTANANSNISPDVQALMDEMQQMRQAQATMQKQLEQANKEKEAAQKHIEKVVQNVKILQKKKGFNGKIIDVDANSDLDTGKDDKVVYNLDGLSEKGKLSKIVQIAKGVVDSRNIAKVHGYNKENQMTIQIGEES